MHLIGRITLLQIQRASLKAGERPHHYYDPAPLLELPSLRLTPDGVTGQPAGGDTIVDVHNAGHPQSKQVRGRNGISVGFTSHYQAMRERFGPHLTDGCAGENIVVAAERVLELADLGSQLVIVSDDGRSARLGALSVAAPCVEFSRFANFTPEPLSPDDLRATLQFLGNGMRGFYARLADSEAEVRVGDRVYRLS
jgi:hypothetical protein